ncbi:gluconate permease [Microbacterium bovistercoris]|uniref:Gluconate permease n=1 Tax=Microbacterium bovistercoris TaxID=2293570 RepID=A0A371NV81_9MICO|nr:gluconate permease [Microbacterium bovistercoris]REJ06479.1 gluconate permease [Microbacterium bovistercoris]
MPDWYTLGVVALVIIAVVLAIVRFRINPVIALAVGAAGIGLLTGLGPVDTVKTMTTGFGEVMMEAGLLIAWGVLIGAMLNEMGAITRLVDTLLRAFGPKGIPYALGLSFATYLQTIFIDVMIVMAAPLARRIAPRLGKAGTGIIAATFAISLETGIVLMVPGFAAVALAGLLDVPLGIMMLGGLAVVVPTVILAIIVMTVLFRAGFWNPARDEEETIHDESSEEEPALVRSASAADGVELDSTRSGTLRTAVGGTPNRHASGAATAAAGEPPLLLLFGPMLSALALIAAQAVLTVLGIENPVMQFLGDPVIALLLAVIATGLVGRAAVGIKRIEKSLVKGFQDGGQIFVLTGVGGSLAAVIAQGDLGEVLKGYFQATTWAPILVVWVMAALLHIAVGSVTLSAITAAGIIAPAAASLGLNPLIIALAAGAGALFCIHVTSNTFWLLKLFLGQSVRGALKTVTIGVSVASVIALGMTLILSVFVH